MVLTCTSPHYKIYIIRFSQEGFSRNLDVPHIWCTLDGVDMCLQNNKDFLCIIATKKEFQHGIWRSRESQ